MFTAFIACNVRRNDKTANEAKLAEIALHDTTQVQLIDSLYDFGTVIEGKRLSIIFDLRMPAKNHWLYSVPQLVVDAQFQKNLKGRYYQEIQVL